MLGIYTYRIHRTETATTENRERYAKPEEQHLKDYISYRLL